MKRSMAVLAALAIGFAYSSPGAVVLAEENNKEKIIEDIAAESMECEEDITEKEDSLIDNLLGNLFSIREEKEDLSREESGLKNLQIPQKFEVVIDPWEMDGKGQIYSEQYIISNTGDTTGILILSDLVCTPREQNCVVVRTDREGLHNSGDKSIYMEMLLGNGERIIFTPESSQYQTELKPGEELSICFAGEVNENAFGKWENDDITVSVVYSWNMEEAKDDKNKEELKDNLRADDNAEQEKEKSHTEELEEKEHEGNPEEKLESNMDEEKAQERQDDISDSALEKEVSNDEKAEIEQSPSVDLPAEEANGQEIMGTAVEDRLESSLDDMLEDLPANEKKNEITEVVEEKIKYIELQKAQKVDVVIGPWEVDEKRQIVSSKYMLQNTGDTVGTWGLSELACKLQEQSEIRICTDKKEMQESDAKSVYLELIPGNGEKIVASQKNFQYEVELKPGEALSVQFVGEVNGSLFENQDDGDIIVTAVCTWNIEQNNGGVMY